MSIYKIKNKLYDIDKNICEEKTKHYLVLPFIKYLEYDIFSPLDIIPEYKPKHYTGNERIDYALCNGGVPKIYMEVKRLREELNEEHIKWLAKYFNSDPYINLGVLTNGERYLFFTDSQHENIMDKDPFYEFNLNRYTKTEKFILDYFSKGTFNEFSIEYCKELINNIGKLEKAFLLLYENKSYFFKLKEESDDTLMKKIYDIACITENEITLELAYDIVPINIL